MIDKNGNNKLSVISKIRKAKYEFKADQREPKKKMEVGSGA